VYLLSLVMLALVRMRRSRKARRRFARTQPTPSANSGLTVNRSEVLWQLALLGLAGLLGALLAAGSATVASPELGALLLGALCGVLGMLMLWQVVRMQQPVAALALGWLLLAGTWNMPLPAFTLPASSGLQEFLSIR